jgi:hypothetical protein
MTSTPARTSESIYQELLPDYSELFKSVFLSDVNVILKEEGPQTEDVPFNIIDRLK